MTDYKYKYEKYKRKYLDLKNNLSGGQFSLTDFYQTEYVDDKKLKEIIDKSLPNVQNIYTKIVENILPKLETLGLSADIVPLPLSKNDKYWTDYPYDYFKEKHDKEWFTKPFLYFVIYINKEGNALNLNRDISINFYKMDKNMKIKVINLFENTLPNNYEWTGKNYNTMKIYYESKDIKKIDTSKLKSEDEFPLLTISLNVKVNLFEVDIYKLPVIENILTCTKGFDNQLEYGQDDAYLRLLGVEENKIYKIYSCILNEINDKNNQVVSYSAYYFINNDEYYELKNPKGFIKDKHAYSYKDFVKKYEK